jgi:hypothetical protein
MLKGENEAGQIGALARKKERKRNIKRARKKKSEAPLRPLSAMVRRSHPGTDARSLLDKLLPSVPELE